jgi:hypothetical protein
MHPRSAPVGRVSYGVADSMAAGCCAQRAGESGGDCPPYNSTVAELASVAQFQRPGEEFFYPIATELAGAALI